APAAAADTPAQVPVNWDAPDGTAIPTLWLTVPAKAG
ncbi:MAG: hypothetical protein RLZZ436_2638, partial [Planctomycetota bacterium]